MATEGMASERTGERLVRNSIGPGHIVFFVVAAAAPLTAVVGASPPAFAFGNGAGVPGTYVVAGLLYLIFSAGFTAMSRHVGTTGGFYVYIAKGLGPQAGMAGAMIAVLTYTALQVAVLALAGVFLSTALAPAGITLPWWLLASAVVLVALLAGRREIAFSGNVLGVCMIAEILILLLLDAGILLRGGGPQGIDLSGFAPAQIFAPGIGIAMVFVVGSFMGFEATALFAEETATPERTIPRATYVAVLLIMGFYAFSTWSIAQFYGAADIRAAATGGLDTLFFRAADVVLGPWASQTMRLLLIVSLFACSLSLHSAINRYLLTLAREGVLPPPLARLHPRHRSPHIAGLVQAGSAIAVVGAFALGGLDPYAIVFAWTSAFATMGILVVQIMVCGAIVVFFHARRAPGAGILRAVVAPVVAGIGLAVVLALVVRNLPLMAGSDNPVLGSFPYIILAAGACGALLERWRHPSRTAAAPGAAGATLE